MWPKNGPGSTCRLAGQVLAWFRYAGSAQVPKFSENLEAWVLVAVSHLSLATAVNKLFNKTSQSLPKPFPNESNL